MGSCVLFLVHGTVLQQWKYTDEESCQGRKKMISWLLNIRASDCWRIVQATLEESCKLIQKHKMDVRYNVNIKLSILNC